VWWRVSWIDLQRFLIKKLLAEKAIGSFGKKTVIIIFVIFVDTTADNCGAVSNTWSVS
jgi:hypothetical protein